LETDFQIEEEKHYLCLIGIDKEKLLSDAHGLPLPGRMSIGSILKGGSLKCGKRL
jgi:hypothetical protein